MLSVAEQLAAKYALAIFEIAQEKNMLDEIQKQLDATQDLLQVNPELNSVVANLLIPKEPKMEILKQVLATEVDPILLSFLLVLVGKNRISLFNNIHRAYTNLMNEKNNIVEIKVTTARNLSETEYAEVTEKVGKILNKNIILIKHVNPEIMGGIIIQMGDKLIDGSIARQLKNMEKSLKSIDMREIGVTN